MRWRRQRRHGWLLVFIFAIMVLASLLVMLERRLVPVMNAIAQKKVEVLATRVINEALMETLEEELRYSSLVYTEKDSTGRIVFMQPNLVAVNRIKLSTLHQVQAALGNLGHVRFGIPLGELVGSRLFATRGPELAVGAVPVGTADVSVHEQFEEAGINQTRHVLYLRTRAKMRIVVPLYSEIIEVTDETPLVESIIVGDVPDSYFELKWGQ